MIAVAEFDRSSTRTSRGHKPQHPLTRPVTLDALGIGGRVTNHNGRRNRQVFMTVCGHRIEYGFPFEVTPHTEGLCGHCFPSLAS